MPLNVSHKRNGEYVPHSWDFMFHVNAIATLMALEKGLITREESAVYFDKTQPANADVADRVWNNFWKQINQPPTYGWIAQDDHSVVNGNPGESEVFEIKKGDVFNFWR